jgi:hypothetical protein
VALKEVGIQRVSPSQIWACRCHCVDKCSLSPLSGGSGECTPVLCAS